MDVEQLRRHVSPRTRAIIPVHLFGLAAEMKEINETARAHGLVVVEDAACGFGSRYHGSHVGTLGDAGCFSFHPRKAITTGEGGMITTNDEMLAQKLRRLRDHGAAMTDLQRHLGARPYLLADHPDAGYNQRMTDMQAALGAAQMNRAEEIVRERQRLARIYDSAFAGLSWLKTPAHKEGLEHGYQSYPCLFQPEPVTPKSVDRINGLRNEWMDQLQTAGISTRPATHAVHMLGYYRDEYGHQAADFPNAYAANHCSISLPLFHGMTEAEQGYVIQCVLNPTLQQTSKFTERI
jgi:perosamine synthetase